MDPSFGELLARIGLRVFRWTRSRAFSAPPLFWHASILLAFLVAGVAMACGPIMVAAVAMVAAIACSGPAARWRRLRRGRNGPLVILARFRGESPAYEQVATVHIHQIERRLHRNDLLCQAIDLRTEDIPLNESQARRLMTKVHAAVIISGSGLTVRDHARWEGWVLSSWPGEMSRTQEHGETGARRLVDTESVVDVAAQDELPPDAEQELSILTAEIFPATHAKAIEAFLLVNAAAWSHPSELSEELMDAANATKDELPQRARVALEIYYVFSKLEENGDTQQAVSALRALGEQLDHELIWETCFMLMTKDPSFSASERLEIARRSLAANPEYVPALTNMGLTLLLLGRQAEAREKLLAAHERAARDAPANLDAVLAAHLYFAGGGREDWLRWRDVFRTVRRHNRPGVMWQLQLSREDLRRQIPPTSFGRLPWIDE